MNTLYLQVIVSKDLRVTPDVTILSFSEFVSCLEHIKQKEGFTIHFETKNEVYSVKDNGNVSLYLCTVETEHVYNDSTTGTTAIPEEEKQLLQDLKNLIKG